MRWMKRRERGSVTVLVAVLLGAGVLFGTSALVVDVGSLYVEREELQSGADAAAMAVAAACPPGTCNPAAARRLAEKYADDNAADGHAEVVLVCGSWDGLPSCPAGNGNLTDCIGAEPDGSFVEVRVRTESRNGSRLLPPSFAATLQGNSAYTGTTVAACSRAEPSSLPCVEDPNDARYEHTFDGASGRATITAVRRLCSGEEVTLVAYTKKDDNRPSYPQYVYDSETGTIPPSGQLELRVDVPACYTQVDFVFRSKPINPLFTGAYGPAKVGDNGMPGSRSSGVAAWDHYGNTTCRPEPTVSFVSQSNGSMLVQLGNNASANIDAVFTVTFDGRSNRHRVAPGAARTVTVPAGSASEVIVEQNTIDGNGFRTTTGRWTQP